MTPKELLKIKHDYYLNVKSKVEMLLGDRSRHIKTYRSNYDLELKNTKWSIVAKKDFFASLNDNQIIITGDFHAHLQTTKSILRLSRKLGAQNIVIGLESFYVEHQDFLNDYLAGNLTENDFLRKIEWKKNWGFPWEFTRPVLKWAAQNKVPIVALNKLSLENLNERDKFSAKMIVQASNLYSDKKMIVQYGEYHLADSHLPRQIRALNSKIKTMVILQSPEKIFFELMKQGRDPALVDFVKLTKGKWAMMSVVPWVKWQDYLLYIESGHDRKIKVDDYDFTDHVSQAIHVLNTVLDLKLHHADFSVYSVNDEILFDKINQLSSADKKFYTEAVLSGNSFYCPEGDFGFVARPTLNQISKVAALCVLFKSGVFLKSMTDPQKDFLKLIWLELLVYFLTKIINPKKKSDTLEDIRVSLRNENFSDKGKDALVLALEQKMNEVRFVATQNLPKSDVKNKAKNRKSFFVAAQILGGIMGEKIYYAYKRKNLNWKRQKSFLFKDLQSRFFSQSYYESVEIIDSWPASFKSKFDRF